MPPNDSQLYFIGKAAGSSKVLDYWTADDAVFPRSTKCFSLGRNNHPLIVFPEGETGFVDFQGVLPPSGILKVILFWASTVGIGDVLWEVAWERDNATVLIPQADLDVDSFAASKTVSSTAPSVSGTLREASIVFTPVEMGGTLPGDPYRLRVKRNSGVFPDFMPGDAQLFRVVIGAA
jgi:hypothetical protein